MTQTVSALNQAAEEPGEAGSAPADADLRRLLDALEAVRDGDFGIRLDLEGKGVLGEMAAVFADLVDRNRHLCTELVRVRRVVGRDGRLDERLSMAAGEGS